MAVNFVPVEASDDWELADDELAGLLLPQPFTAKATNATRQAASATIAARPT
jgi:hypothetical protein